MADASSTLRWDSRRSLCDDIMAIVRIRNETAPAVRLSADKKLQAYRQGGVGWLLGGD